MPHAIPIRLTGRALPGHPKPALLGSFARSTGAPAADDGFLPSAYIKVETSFDVGTVARSATGTQVLDQVFAMRARNSQADRTNDRKAYFGDVMGDGLPSYPY